MKYCSYCNAELTHEEKTIHPISKVGEVTYFFKCGRRVKLVKHNGTLVPMELRKCRQN